MCISDRVHYEHMWVFPRQFVSVWTGKLSQLNVNPPFCFFHPLRMAFEDNAIKWKLTGASWLRFARPSPLSITGTSFLFNLAYYRRSRETGHNPLPLHPPTHTIKGYWMWRGPWPDSKSSIGFYTCADVRYRLFRNYHPAASIIYNWCRLSFKNAGLARREFSTCVSYYKVWLGKIFRVENFPLYVCTYSKSP